MKNPGPLPGVFHAAVTNLEVIVHAQAYGEPHAHTSFQMNAVGKPGYCIGGCRGLGGGTWTARGGGGAEIF